MLRALRACLRELSRTRWRRLRDCNVTAPERSKTDAGAQVLLGQRQGESYQRREGATRHGHGFALALGTPALFVPRPLSMPPARPVTRLNATSPGPGSSGSKT